MGVLLLKQEDRHLEALELGERVLERLEAAEDAGVPFQGRRGQLQLGLPVRTVERRRVEPLEPAANDREHLLKRAPPQLRIDVLRMLDGVVPLRSSFNSPFTLKSSWSTSVAEPSSIRRIPPGPTDLRGSYRRDGLYPPGRAYRRSARPRCAGRPPGCCSSSEACFRVHLPHT